MPNTTFNFSANSFTNSSPDWASSTNYSPNMRFQTVSKTLVLDNTNYGRGVYTVSINTGDYDYGCIHFSTPNQSVLSVSNEDPDELHVLSNFPDSPVSFIFKEDGQPFSTETFYVISNGDPNITTGTITISIALGNNNANPSSNPILNFNWDCPVSINEYTVGLHTWSPFGAKASTSTLTTKLYSKTPIENWGVNTKVYSSPYFANPALPYYYGYNGKVFKVGDDWSRSFGIKYKIQVRVKRRLFRSTKVTSKTITLGPFETLNNNGGSPISSACIEPIMGSIGKIKQIWSNDSVLVEPEQYEYYLGYDQNNQRNSNDSVFNKWHYGKKRAYGILGWQHALQKFTLGITSGYNKEWGDINWNMLAGAAGLGAVGAFKAQAVKLALDTISNWWVNTALNGFLAEVFGSFGSNTTLSAILTNPWTFWIGVIIFVIIAFWNFFKTKTYYFEEDCSDFLHHFSDGEYINIGDELFRDETLSTKNPGYYCDGVYFYYQVNNGAITGKELSSTNALINEDPLTFKFGYSLPADNPTLVEEFTALVLLPYCSGKPVPYCGLNNPIFYSAELTHTVTVQCCELEDCSDPEVITLPYGSVTSCISINDANTKAQAQFQASIDFATTNGVYATSIDDDLIGVFTTHFTHEIKQETIPTEVTLYFDIRNGSNAPIGTPLFYDFTGCQRALPGYYAISSSNYPKTYYKVENGEVASIEVQQTAGSTTTTPSGLPIVTDNLDYQSNWYLNNGQYQTLQASISNTNDRTFDVNSYFSSSPFILTAGIVIPVLHTDFLRYNSFGTGGITTNQKTEQPSSWYVQLNDWKPEDEDYFQYQSSLSTFNGSGLATILVVSTLCGLNLNTPYFFNGEGNLPSTGDRIYNSDNSNDPTNNGWIKYTTNNYLSIEDGVVTGLFSCSPQFTFDGSIYSTSSDFPTPYVDTIDYEYTSPSNYASPSIGSAITYPSTTNPPSNPTYPSLQSGFIRNDNAIYQLNNTGVIANIFLNNQIGYWSSPGYEANFNMNSDSTTNGGFFEFWQGYIGSSNASSTNPPMGTVDRPFFNNDGWFVTELTWNKIGNQDDYLSFTIYNVYTYGPAYDNNKPDPINPQYTSLNIKDYDGNNSIFSFDTSQTNFTKTTNASNIPNKIEYTWTFAASSISPFGNSGAPGNSTTAVVSFINPSPY